MTTGSRRIRVTCSQCHYDKVRTLKAGDDRTLVQLRASLRCGDCRAGAKRGAVSVTPVYEHSRKTARRTSPPRESDEKAASGSLPPWLLVCCAACGASNVLKRRRNWGATLEAIARSLHCNRCGASGADNNVTVEFCDGYPPRERATRQTKNSRGDGIVWRVSVGLIWMTVAALATPFLLAAVYTLLTTGLPLLANAVAAIAIPAVVILAGVGAVASAWAIAISVKESHGNSTASLAFFATLAGVVVAAGLVGVGSRLLVRAMDYEVSDNVRHSPNGGYYER